MTGDAAGSVTGSVTGRVTGRVTGGVTGGPQVVVHDPDVLAQAVAARLLVTLTDVQARRSHAHVALTGGRIAAKVYQAVAASPVRQAVDWRRVDFWWGDERYLPAGDPDRNETQARTAFLDDLGVAAAALHPMPAAGVHADAAQAAAAYAAELGGTHLDLVLLGVGEDGHVASIFPGTRQQHRAGAGDDTAGRGPAVVAVADSPKPPPVRLSLSLARLDSADEVWLIASGAGKADAVGAALSGLADLPAALVHGRRCTRWLLDGPAAARLPG